MLILSLIHVQQKKHIYFSFEIDMLNSLRQNRLSIARRFKTEIINRQFSWLRFIAPLAFPKLISGNMRVAPLTVTGSHRLIPISLLSQMTPILLLSNSPIIHNV